MSLLPDEEERYWVRAIENLEVLIEHYDFEGSETAYELRRVLKTLQEIRED